jgi:hypothetical protein
MATATLAPATASEWKGCLRERLRDPGPIFGDPRLFARFLKHPLFPHLTRHGECYEEAFERANSRFHLSESDCSA